MKFFYLVKNLDELKKEYRRLALKYHPDRGGDTETMQQINDLYDKLSQKFINSNPEFSEERKVYEKEVSEELREAINKIVFLPNIEIEIIGSWIWVTGNTFFVREDLKAAGFKFSHVKLAWYWHKGEYSKRNGNVKSLDSIREMFGSQSIKNDKVNSLT